MTKREKIRILKAMLPLIDTTGIYGLITWFLPGLHGKGQGATAIFSDKETISRNWTNSPR